VLQEIDPDLNIFALANGVDLLRDADPPARVLEWYRDGMDRRVVVTPAAGDSGGVDLAVQAEARGDAGRRRLTHPFQAGAAPGQLREVLPRAVDACNALARADVEREGQAR
jgi:hypothetical protein